MDKNAPQVAELVHRSLPFTIHDVKWVPGTARFVVLGCPPRGTGLLYVYELDGLELQQMAQMTQPHALKCGSFSTAASGCHLAVGNQAGQLQLLDIERLDAGPLFAVQAHAGIVNALDTYGGSQTNDSTAGPVIATCGKDGGVRVWDPRTPDTPTAAFLPAAAPTIASGTPAASAAPTASDCWCVALGNCHNLERCVLAGYESGDLKMFDLRTAAVRWETHVGKGVCGVQFDRRDIAMNKFVASCLEGQLCLYDARTEHSRRGFTGRLDRVAGPGQDATLWGVHHLPQNRDVFMVRGGDGSLALHKYMYPDQRSVKEPDTGEVMGVVGSSRLICDRVISSQPVSAFDWSGDKAGVFVAAAFDQTVRVGMVRQINTL